jgi:DNA-binding transcriptional regulator YhcF (GntR family)
VTGRLQHFGIDGDPRPWVRVADRLLDRIADGEFVPGDVLPPIDDLRIDAGLRNRNTVSRALRALEQRGVVRWFRGTGYLVLPEDAAPAAPPAMTAPGQAVLAEALRWAWAGVYRISGTSGSYEAWRTDRSGSVHAATAEELRDAIREDWPKYARTP